MAEEERSRRNEEYIADLEKEKLAMGITQVLPRRSSIAAMRGKRLDYASGIPADDAGLVFTDGGSLSSSWTLLGLPGNYPAVDYWSRRAVLLKRSSTKILEVRAAQDRVEVYFRLLNTGETSDPAKDRFATLPLEPQPVSLILLSR